MPFDGDLLLLSNSSNELDNQSVNLNISSDEYIFSTSASNELPSELTMDDIKLFQKTHDDYSMKLYQACLKFQYDFIEKLMQQFWSLTNVHYSQTNELITNGKTVER
jgi:hypothetical protein